MQFRKSNMGLMPRQPVPANPQPMQKPGVVGFRPYNRPHPVPATKQYKAGK